MASRSMAAGLTPARCMSTFISFPLLSCRRNAGFRRAIEIAIRIHRQGDVQRSFPVVWVAREEVQQRKRPFSLLAWRKVLALCVIAATALPAQTFRRLFSFDNTDGNEPSVGPVQATNGDLYGTTIDGGANCLNPYSTHTCGTVFKTNANAPQFG